MSSISRRQFLVASAGVTVGLLAACAPAAPAAPGQAQTGEQAPAEQAKKAILVWGQFGEQSAGVDELVSAFNASQSEYVVTREAQENMRDILRTALDAGAGPDVMYYDTGPGFAGVLARAGMLAPLDDSYALYGWNDRILPIAKERASFDGVAYGIGNELEVVGTYYNQRIFDELGLSVPTSHDEFLALCEALKAAGLIPLSYGNQDKWPAGHTFSVFSGNIAGKDKMAAAISAESPWNDEEFVLAIQIPFVDMVQAGYYNSDVNAVNYDDSNLLFYNGQAALRLTGSWMVGDFSNPEVMTDPVGFFFYPAVNNKPIAPPAGLGSGYFVSKATQNPEGAFQFLDFLFTEESAKNWLEGMSMIPPIKLNPADYNIPDLLGLVLTSLQESGDQMGFNIDVLTPDNYNTMMFDGFQEVIGGIKTAQQQADDLEAAMQTAKEEGKVMDITE